MVSTERTFLGLDLSTQQLKAAVIDDNLQIIHEAAVNFDSDLPEFRTHGGAIIDKTDPNYITAPTVMFVKALDMLLDKLTVAGVDFSKISAISGSAQQHGTVYWQKGSEKFLQELDPSRFLHEQLATCFSITNGPIWMDASTTKQCKEIEKAVGGPEKLAVITGSKAYERFSGSQIAKIYQTKPDSYKNTERISMISSFLSSLFIGKYAPTDISDGSGMNLLNIRSKKWDQTLLNAVAPNLEAKLGQPVPSITNVGQISQYFVERYGFSSDCKIFAAVGDNLASLVGMKLSKDWIAVSLGTSDTVFLWLTEPKVVLNGHVFCNPIAPDHYVGLLCFKNGSLTRERIRNTCTEGSWDLFNQLLESTPRGNFGNIGLYYDEKEILPFLSGDFRFNKAGDRVSKFTSLEVEVRALVEGQFIARRAYAEDFGIKLGSDTKILTTGGASENKAILQVLADVFNSPVYVQDNSKSAMLGAAYLAKIGASSGEGSYVDLVAGIHPPRLLCTPFPDASEIYEPMVTRYKKIVDSLLTA